MCGKAESLAPRVSAPTLSWDLSLILPPDTKTDIILRMNESPFALPEDSSKTEPWKENVFVGTVEGSAWLNLGHGDIGKVLSVRRLAGVDVVNIHV